MRTSWKTLIAVALAALATTLNLPAAAQLGNWSPVGNMNVTRLQHAVTPLLDGRVLVVGGHTVTGSTTVELYDPVTQTFTLTGPTSHTFREAFAVRLLDGRVLVAGGRCCASTGEPNAEIYNPATGTWAVTGSLNQARTGYTLTLLTDGRVLAAGGYGPAGFQNSAEIHNPVTGLWTFTGSMAAGRWAHTATLLNDGRVLVAGGEDYGFCNTNCALTSAEIYSPVSGTWSTGGNVNFARIHHRAELLPDGKILVMGGFVESNVFPPFALNSAELFDPATGLWTATGSLQDSRYLFVSAQLPDGRVLVAGGLTITSGTTITLSGAEQYDPVSGSWTTIAGLNQPRYSHAGTLLSDGSVLLAGGSDGSQVLGSAERWASSAAPSDLIATGRTDTKLYVQWQANGNTMFTLDYLGPEYFGGVQPTCNDFPPHNNIRETSSHVEVIEGLQPSTWYFIHVHAIDPVTHLVLDGSTNVIIVKTSVAGSGFESLAAGSSDYIICGSGDPSATTLLSITVSPSTASVEVGKTRSFFAMGHFTSGPDQPLSTVSWQSLDPAIAAINSSNSALGVAPGQTTIVATALVNGSTVSCATTNTCAALTVTAPMRLTLTLAPGSVVFPSVEVTATMDGETEGPFTLLLDQPIDPGAGDLRLLFFAPSGYTVTPAQVDLYFQAGDDITIALFFAAIDTTPPVLTVSGNLIAEATGASGAIVTFLPPTATDDSGVQSVSCDRSSGESFAIGVTTVQCSATDTAGNVANQGFTVTVQDTTPPALTLPSNLVTDATSPAGATVVFTVSATDLVDGARPVVCAPVSGSVFAIGLTTVNCTTADTRGNASAGGFTVTVRSAAQVVTDLAALAASADFQQGSNLLQNVLTSIGSGDAGAACQQLEAFISQAQAQTGKKLTVAQAAALIAAANSGKAALGCS